MYSGLGRTVEESVMAYFEVLFQHLAGGSENCEKLLSNDRCSIVSWQASSIYVSHVVT
jgi:hypothetical protein